MRKVSLSFAIFAVFAAGLCGLDLKVNPQDVRIEERGDGGYHLYIRKKPDISSVLLVESTKDPAKLADNVAYRSKEANPVNGTEKRLLNGKFIEPDPKLHSLIDSTPEKDETLGMAFHIFMPYVVEYGYAWSRSGEIFLSDGTFVGIRAFEKPYADYAGAFLDNPYLIKVTQKARSRPEPPPPEPIPEAKPDVSPEIPAPLPPEPKPNPPEPPAPKPEEPPKGNYMKDTVDTFKEIADKGKGDIEYAKGPNDIVPKISKILEDAKGKSIDLVVCLDTTESMTNDIESVKKGLIPMVKSTIKEYADFRIGMVLYKDYFEEYTTRKVDFTSNFLVFQKALDAVRVMGGRDIPEAVYEALYSAETEFDWRAEKKAVILIGDAPPHPLPRGKVTKDMVTRTAEEKGIELNVIILAQ
jgi:hypothetical protein